MTSIKIYLDTCCYNRPFDDLNHDRIYLEAEAVIKVINHIRDGRFELVSSDAVVYEVQQIKDEQRRNDIDKLVQHAETFVEFNEDILARGIELEEQGFGAFDSLHIACAEFSECDYLLTVDDKMHNKSLSGNIVFIKVENPLFFIKEVSK